MDETCSFFIDFSVVFFQYWNCIVSSSANKIGFYWLKQFFFSCNAFLSWFLSGMFICGNLWRRAIPRYPKISIGLMPRLARNPLVFWGFGGDFATPFCFKRNVFSKLLLREWAGRLTQYSHCAQLTQRSPYSDELSTRAASRSTRMGAGGAGFELILSTSWPSTGWAWWRQCPALRSEVRWPLCVFDSRKTGLVAFDFFGKWLSVLVASSRFL